MTEKTNLFGLLSNLFISVSCGFGASDVTFLSLVFSGSSAAWRSGGSCQALKFKATQRNTLKLF